MDTIDQETVNSIANVVGGGWPALIITVLIGVAFAYFKHKAKEAQRAEADKATQKASIDAKIEAKESNPEKQAAWDEATNDIEAIRKQAHAGETDDKDSK